MNLTKQQEAEEMIILFQEVFASDSGERILQYLERECLEDDIVGVRSHEQYAYLQGKRDLLRVIKKLALADCDTLKEYLNKIKGDLKHGNI